MARCKLRCLQRMCRAIDLTRRTHVSRIVAPWPKECHSQVLESKVRVMQTGPQSGVGNDRDLFERVPPHLGSRSGKPLGDNH
jgi:hypothetical protein